MSWRRKIPVSRDVLFDVFTVLGVYTLSLSVSLKVRGKFVESGLKILRNHSCLPDHRNKVGISFPARNNMKMQVTRYPGSSTFPDIEANVEAIGLIHLL